MASALDQVIGFFGGGPSQVDAAGGAALAISKIDSLRNTVLDNVQAFGAKLGPVWGSDIFKRLAVGADAPAAAAVAAEQQKIFGISKQTALIGGGVVLLVLLLLAVSRK